jgi:hypothetical protein
VPRGGDRVPAASFMSYDDGAAGDDAKRAQDVRAIVIEDTAA